jgi:hypothetical protein
MRKLLAALLFVPALVSAESVTIEKKVVCDTLEIIIETFIKGDPKEEIFWIGQDSATSYALLINEKTRTWSLIQFKENVACVLGIGEGSKILEIGEKI